VSRPDSRFKKFQPGRLVPVATVFGSRSDIFFGSRPILGRDPENILGRGLDRVEVPNTSYRFGCTVLVDCTASRTFLSVFRDFFFKARTLPRFKCSRSANQTLIFRKSANRTVPKPEPFFVILTLKTLI
jgi:hypothetical protein